MRKLKGSLLSLYSVISRGVGRFDDDLHDMQKWASPKLNIYFLLPTEARLSQA